MSNVIEFPNTQEAERMRLGPANSELYFTAVERPLYWKSQSPGGMTDPSMFNSVDTHKCLLRAENGSPVQLAVVGKKYKIVQNRELFDAIEHQLITSLDARGVVEQGGPPELEHALQDVQVVDDMSYNGRTCFREYRFPNMKCPMPGTKSDVAFRIIALNGFGGSAVKLFSGAIDFFCTNGMISGRFEAFYARHSSGLRISNIEKHVRGAVDIFYKQAEVWQHWARTELTNQHVQEWLRENFSERRAEQLFRQWLIEMEVHGRTKWALYSALTYYATHDEGLFTLRQTQTDHRASTLHNREMEVHRLATADEFMQLGVAA